MIWTFDSAVTRQAGASNTAQPSAEYRENRYAVGRNGLTGSSPSSGKFGIGKAKTGKPKYHMGTRLHLWQLRNQ